MTYDYIINESKLPWLKLNIAFPYEEMLQEAKALRKLFVPHRPGNHKGWYSLCIHGISSTHTNHFSAYGYDSNENTPYVWTDIVEKCPVTFNYFKNIFPFTKYNRLRFMLLESKGYIEPHVDYHKHKLSPINIALNNPETCYMKMKNIKGYVPFKDGTAFMLDVSNEHACFNNSNEDRYHIIVHGTPAESFKKIVQDSYENR